jgi:hypothetical protein
LVKLVIVEIESEVASQLWETPLAVASSILCYAEGRAALSGARRGGRLTAAGYRLACEGFESLQSELLIVSVDSALVHQAGELAKQQGLRGYDAVHLASALSFATDTTVVSWDDDRRLAAAECGCAIAPAQ